MSESQTPDSQRPEWIKPELNHALRDTAATLGRLGNTLSALSLSAMTPGQRNSVERIATEVRRAGELVPRTLNRVLTDRTEASGRERPVREDLGSRLRRMEGEQDDES